MEELSNLTKIKSRRSCPRDRLQRLHPPDLALSFHGCSSENSHLWLRFLGYAVLKANLYTFHIFPTGSYVAKELIKSRVAQESRRVVLTSRNTQKLDKLVQRLQPSGGPTPLSSAQVDIQNTSQLGQVFKDASLVVSLVGILRGSKADFENLQWHGARNVAVAAQEAGAKLVHISAIGADPDSPLDYPRTKGLGERDILKAHPSATIIRPSLVFGPGDEFFAVS